MAQLVLGAVGAGVGFMMRGTEINGQETTRYFRD